MLGKTKTMFKKHHYSIVTQQVFPWLVGVAAVGNETCICQIWSRVLSECSSGPCGQCLQAERNGSQCDVRTV